MKITPATIAAHLYRKGADRATMFYPGCIVRKRDNEIVIRYCAEMKTPRLKPNERENALISYRTWLADAGVTAEDKLTDWGEPYLVVEINRMEYTSNSTFGADQGQDIDPDELPTPRTPEEIESLKAS